MHLWGRKDRYSNTYQISFFIYNQKLGFNIIDFMIDTGASQTALSIKDALKLNLLKVNPQTFELINNHNLPLEKTHTANGSIDLLKLDNVTLSQITSETSFFVEYLKEIYIMKPPIDDFNDYKDMMDIPSLLGMDVLKNYKLNFSNDKVSLEK